MLGLLEDHLGGIRPLVVSARTTDGAIDEVLRRRKPVLRRAGLTTEWLEKYGRDDQGMEPAWIGNVRLHGWWVCGETEADDVIITLYLFDTRAASTTHTGILFDPSGGSHVFGIDCEDSSRHIAEVTFLHRRAIFVQANVIQRPAHTAVTQSLLNTSLNPIPAPTVVAPRLRYFRWRVPALSRGPAVLRLFVATNLEPSRSGSGPGLTRRSSGLAFARR